MVDEGLTKIPLLEYNSIGRKAKNQAFSKDMSPASRTNDKETQCDFPPNFEEVKTYIDDKIKKMNDSFMLRYGLSYDSVCCKCAVSPILGVMYECTRCKDYILCQSCESERHEHPMLMYKKRPGQDKTAPRIPSIRGQNNTKELLIKVDS